MIAIGIDVGVDGGLAAICSNSAVKPIVCRMPVIQGTPGKRATETTSKVRGTPTLIDADALSKWMQNSIVSLTDPTSTDSRVVVCIEAQQAMPKQGLVSTFHLGESYGILQGLTVGLEYRLLKVKPKEWKKTVLPNTTMDKAAAIAFVRQMYPDIDLNIGVRKIIYHDGMADAVCIASYCIRTCGSV